MIPKPGSPTGEKQPSQRFLPPVTPVDQRIDQVAAYGTDWQRQADWLKQTLQEHWKRGLPQPFVGFDEEENAFVLVWQSDGECNTLYIDADNHSGTYCPWPDSSSDEPLGKLNLYTEKAWLFVKNALTGMTD